MEATPTTHHEEEEFELHPPDTILFIFLALLLGAVLRAGTKFLPITIPYTVLLLLIGLGWGEINHGSKLGEAGLSVSNINPELFTHIFFPLLIFESAFSLHWHVFKRSLAQMFILAVFGVLVATALTSVVVRYIIEPDWEWANALTLGAILSATDPVAVVAILKEVGASTKLSVLLEGESLLNDGTAIVLFIVFLDIAKGEDLTGGDITETYVRLSLGGLTFGFVWALATIGLVGLIHRDAKAETTVTIASAFLLFYVSEELEVSGVLAIVTMGVCFVWFGKTRISPDVIHTLESFWEILAFQGETVLFVLAGVVMSQRVGLSTITGEKLGYLLVLYIFLTLIRTFMIVLFSPILYRLGYKFGPRRAVVLIHGGLRGAVSLALALIVDLEGESIDEEIRADTLLYASGITLLTLLINATTTASVVNGLGLSSETAAERSHFRSNLKAFRSTVEQKCDDLRVYSKFSGINWHQVRNFVRPNVEGMHGGAGAQEGPSEPYEMTQLDGTGEAVVRDNPVMWDFQEVKEGRLRFLQGFKQKVHQMLLTGSVARSPHDALFDAAESADDYAHIPLCLWHRYLASYCATPRWISALSTYKWSPIQKLHQYASLQHVKRAINVADGFIEGYQHMLQYVSGTSDLAKQLRAEAIQEIALAEAFLRKTSLKHRTQLTTSRSITAAQVLLYGQRLAIHEYELRGLFTEKEVERLSEHIDERERKIILTGVKFEAPTNDEILWANPLFWHTPISVFESILMSQKLREIKTGDTVLAAGAAVREVAFILDGHCQTKGADGHRVNLKAGAIAGLYEALNGFAASESIQAISNCTVAVVGIEALEKLFTGEDGEQVHMNAVLIAAHHASNLYSKKSEYHISLDQLMTTGRVLTLAPNTNFQVSTLAVVATGAVGSQDVILSAGSYQTIRQTEVVALENSPLAIRVGMVNGAGNGGMGMGKMMGVGMPTTAPPRPPKKKSAILPAPESTSA